MDNSELNKEKPDKQSGLTNYYHNLHKSNKSLNMYETISEDKSRYTLNDSSNILKLKGELNPIISNLKRKTTEIRKSILNNIKNSFIAKSMILEKQQENPSDSQVEEYKNEISPKRIVSNKLILRNSLNHINNSTNISKDQRFIFNRRLKSKTKSYFPLRDLNKSLSTKNIYFMDFIKDKNEGNKTRYKILEDIKEQDNKNDNKYNLKNNALKIERLAKDLNLFQNDKHFPIINLKKKRSYSYSDLSLNNLNISEVNNNYNTFISGFNKLNNNLNDNFITNSMMSTRAQSPRNFSENKINFNSSIVNKFKFDKNKIHDMLKKKETNINVITPQEYKYKNEGTNLHSPIFDEAKEMFLYKKIFYLSDKKNHHKTNKIIDNKLNIRYAENEKQLEEKIIRLNKNKRDFDKSQLLKKGKLEMESMAAHVNKRIKFIKGLFDYAFPDILMSKIRNKSNMDKNEIREKRINKLFQQKDLKEKIRKKLISISKQNPLLESIKIEKL